MITCKIHRAGSLRKSPSKWWICDVYQDGKYTGYFIEASKRDAEDMFACIVASRQMDDLLHDA